MKDLFPAFLKTETYTETRYVVYDTISAMYVVGIDVIHPYDFSRDVEKYIDKSKTIVTTFFKKYKADALACCCNISLHGTRYVVHELIVTVDRKENYNHVDTKIKNNIKKIVKENFSYFDHKNPHDSVDGILTLFSSPDYTKYKYLMLVAVSSEDVKTLKSEATTYLNYKNNKRFGINKQKKSLYGFYVKDVASVVNFKLLSSCDMQIKLFDLKSNKFVEL